MSVNAFESSPVFTRLVAVLVVVFIGAPNAHAQTTRAEAEAAPTLDEVVVTARKHDERMTDIPIAITAFSAKDIESLGLQSIMDLPAVTPGFYVQKFTAAPGRVDNNPRFRGIIANTSQPTRQTASVFIDGVFVSGGVQGIELQDVERIEVIKGPQSAYFGRSTFAGAVNYVTKTPGDVLAGKVSLQAGQRSDYGMNASIEGPLLKEKLTGRLSATYHDDGAGVYRAVNSGAELGRERTESVGLALYATPVDNLKIRLNLYYYTNDDGPAAMFLAGLHDQNCGPFGGVSRTICGQVPIHSPGANTSVDSNLRSVLQSVYSATSSNISRFGLDRKSTRLSAQFEYLFPGTNITVDGIFSKNNEKLRLLQDSDETSDDVYIQFGSRKFNDDSQELRLSGSVFNERLKWLIGANHFTEDHLYSFGTIVPALGNAVSGNGAPVLEAISTTGVFGSLIYKLTDKIRVTLEGRQQRDKVVTNGDTTNANTPLVAVENTNFLPRVILDSSVGEGGLVYGSYSKGNLPGGYNATIAVLTPAQLAELRTMDPGASANFAEEELANYEIGWKQPFLENRGLVTLALFHMERTNQTFRQFHPVTDATAPGGKKTVVYFTNAGKSDSDGLEFEGRYKFNEMFELASTLGYVNAKYKVFESSAFNEIFGTYNASGQRVERFPEISGSLSGIFGGPVNANLNWFARADYFFTAKDNFTDEANLLQIGHASQVNLRAGLKTDSYRLEFFFKNVTDDQTPLGVNRLRDLSFAVPLFNYSVIGYNVALQDKRQFGVKASWSF